MSDKQIHIRVSKDIFESSKKLKSMVAKYDDLALFRLYKGKSSWHSFIYEMGLVHLRKEWEKFIEK